GTAQKTGIEADVINAINSYLLLHLGTAPPQLLLAAGLFYLRKSSGSLAMFAAILRSSSRVSGLAVERSLSECRRRPVEQRLWL
ncbi:MAG: hypothetical protein WAR76_12610, partial [Xanthobacteraceae bacterium]